MPNRLRIRILLAAFSLVVCACSNRSAPGTEIGPSGGSVSTPADNPRFTIDVPPGAVTKPLKFAVVPIPGRLPGTAGPAVEATPHGAVFAKPVALRFAVKKDDLAPGISVNELRVATLQNGKWELVPTSHPQAGVIQGLTTHFSTFALVAPCHVVGLGTDFPLSNCPTFNPRIQTSDTAQVDAIGGTVTLRIVVGASLNVRQVNMTISGLSAGKTYYLLADASASTPVTADATGTLTFRQDTSKTHRLLLMAQHGSLTINAANCPLIGTWNGATDTCTLTSDFLDPPLSFEADGQTLDCKDAATGRRHVIGDPARLSAGIQVFERSGITIRNCDISNVDFGIDTFQSSGVTVENVSVSAPLGAFPGGVGVIASDGIRLTNISIDNFTSGIFGQELSGATVRNSTFRTESSPVDLGGRDLLLEDIRVDGTLSGPGDGGVPEQMGAVAIQSVNTATIRRLNASQMGAFQAAIVLPFESNEVIIEGANITGAQTAISVEFGGLKLTGSTLTGNVVGLAATGNLVSGSRLIFRNNIYGNSSLQVFSRYPLELSDTLVGSPTLGQGNYWGRSCPGPLFVTGADSNAATVVDSHPFAAASGWEVGDVPGCSTLATPTLGSPAAGAVLTDSSVLVAGSAEGGSIVTIKEGSVVLGRAVTAASGTFLTVLQMQSGSHTIVAQAVDPAGNQSTASLPRSFSVRVPSPAAPLISVGGDFLLTSVRDAPDPFMPSLGEVNAVAIEGVVLHAPGAQGNHVWQANVRREVVQASTGVVVATFDASAPVVLGPGNQTLLFSLSSGWPGDLQGGGFAPVGGYESNLTIWIIRDPLGAGIPPGFPPGPGGCGPAEQPVDGPCKFDKIVLLNTFGIIDRPGPGLPPALFPCDTIVEECNGKDDNCNGQIDEGIACAVVQQCSSTGSCVPGCHGATCGDVPDGCGGIIFCGGICP